MGRRKGMREGGWEGGRDNEGGIEIGRERWRGGREGDKEGGWEEGRE